MWIVVPRGGGRRCGVLAPDPAEALLKTPWAICCSAVTPGFPFCRGGPGWTLFGVYGVEYGDLCWPGGRMPPWVGRGKAARCCDGDGVGRSGCP